MSADQATELTVRDVLSQVDRRIDLVETDIRKLDSKFDSKFGAMDAKVDARFESMEAKFDTRFESMEAKFDAKFRQLTTTIIAVTGILMASAGAMAAYLKV
jgi:DNA anti-recombination protein RmuC